MGKGVLGKSVKDPYRDIVKSFVTKGNCINDYDIAQVSISPFAFPDEILGEIEGETHMGWTGFVVVMKDGKQFSFGTAFSFEFFLMPEGYLPSDIAQIINHSFLDKAGNVKSYHSPEYPEAFDYMQVFRERPFFECFVEGL